METRPLRLDRRVCRGRPLTVGTPETRGELRPTPRRVQTERHAGDEREEFRQRRDRRERRLAPSPPGYARVLRQPARRARRGGSRPGECAASAHGTVFVGESDGPVRAYNANDGVSRLFIDRDRDKSVNCLAVVNGSDLWVGGAAGDLSVYSLRSPVDGRLVKHGHPKTRPVLAHDKGVWTIANVRDRFVVTGGADFQVRVWNVDGSPRAASHHHSGAVKCVLDFPRRTPSLRRCGPARSTAACSPGTTPTTTDASARTTACSSRGRPKPASPPCARTRTATRRG